LKDTWEDIRDVKAIGVDRKEMFLFGSTRKVRIPKRMVGEVKNVKKDVNRSWEGHQTIKKIGITLCQNMVFMT